MTISSTTNSIRHVGNASTAVYSYPFKVFASSDLKVVKTTAAGVDSTLALTTDYTVTGVGESSGGTITLVAGNLPTNDVIVIRRVVALTQETDLTNGTSFYAETHEAVFDRLMMAIQQLDYDNDRSVLAPETWGGATLSFPAPSAGKVIGWNSDATGLANFSAGSVDLAIPADNSVTAAKIAADAVTTAKIQDGAVTVAKITGALPVAKGGTGSTTAAAARTALGLGDAATKTAGTGAGHVLLLADASKLPALDASNLTLVPRDKYIVIKDSKASATDGGGFTSAAWRTRVLTAITTDETAAVTLVSNQIVLPAGNYRCMIRCPANRVGGHQARLRNVTGSATLIEGESQWANTSNTDTSVSSIVGYFTVAAAQTLEIQHFCATTRNTDGFGLAAGTGESEVYTVAQFWKLT